MTLRYLFYVCVLTGDWDCCDGVKTTYRNWDDGEPNNSGNEDCATVKKNGKWNDIKCANTAETFCKKPVECLH